MEGGGARDGRVYRSRRACGWVQFRDYSQTACDWMQFRDQVEVASEKRNPCAKVCVLNSEVGLTLAPQVGATLVVKIVSTWIRKVGPNWAIQVEATLERIVVLSLGYS